METVLERVKEQYDLVVIDTPPLTAVSDAFPLLGKVDGVVIVGRVGRNRRDVAQRLHETLSGAGAPLLGVIANGFKSGRLGSYGGYGYSYDYAQSRPEPPSGAGEQPASPAGASRPRRRTGRGQPTLLCRRARLERLRSACVVRRVLSARVCEGLLGAEVRDASW